MGNMFLNVLWHSVLHFFFWGGGGNNGVTTVYSGLYCIVKDIKKFRILQSPSDTCR